MTIVRGSCTCDNVVIGTVVVSEDEINNKAEKLRNGVPIYQKVETEFQFDPELAKRYEKDVEEYEEWISVPENRSSMNDTFR